MITATDIFCGAGGSSLGLDFVPGLTVTQAINHWDLAVEAHNENFPDADHDCRDICGVDPRRYTKTDILWASPECTHHSYARGVKAPDDQAERSRATMWDIPRFAEIHKYKAIIVENVIEARKWDPFDSWIQSMHALGYEHEVVYFNSQFAMPTPQSRDRMYVVFWLKGIRKPDLAFRPPCWCLKCEGVVGGVQTWKRTDREPWGRYGTQYLYHCPVCNQPAAPAVTPAATAIDWSLDAPLIGERKKALAPNTMKRIRVGLERLQSMEPAVVAVGGNLYERTGYARVWSVRDPFKAVVATSDRALLMPNMNNNIARSTDEPMGSVTGGNRHYVVEPPAMTVRAGGQAPAPRRVDEPLNTITGHDRQIGLLVYNGNPGFVRSLQDVAGTVTARDKQALLTPYYGTGVAHLIGEPMGTITSKDRQALIITDEDIMNCGFRMLQWGELMRAQHMHVKPDGSEYRLEAQSRKLTNEQRVKMIGNAVSSPVAYLLGEAVAEVLA